MLKKIVYFLLGKWKPFPESPWYLRLFWEVRSLAMVFVVTFFVIQPFVVASYDTPTCSMEPTIMTNTRYLGLPSIYGGFFRFTKIKLPGFKKNQRRDIVIFKYPLDESQNYVKRVIGLPGETIMIKGKVVYINGAALAEPYARFNSVLDQHPNSRSDFGPVTIPEKHLFVMGDNRDNSCDSRYWGFLPIEEVFGTPLFTFWSFDNEQHQVRLKEIFKVVK